MSPFLLKNKNGKPSITTTLTVIGFLIINIKLLFAGVEIVNTIKMSPFSGTDYAACLTAIGGIHVWNKKVNSVISSPQEKDKS